MTLQIISFLMGCILIGVAVIGGGFELKELRVPRVGYGARAFALLVGLAFVGTAIGLSRDGGNGATRPTTHIVIDAPGVRTYTDGDPVSDRPAARPSAPQPTQPVSESQPAAAFAGLQGHVRLTWEMSGSNYVAEAMLNGRQGGVRVSYETQAGLLQVDQDLTLRQSGDVIMFVGSNPRWTANQQPADYYPDYFRVAMGPNGWTITQVCDDSGRCSPVATEVLP